MSLAPPHRSGPATNARRLLSPVQAPNQRRRCGATRGKSDRAPTEPCAAVHATALPAATLRFTAQTETLARRLEYDNKRCGAATTRRPDRVPRASPTALPHPCPRMIEAAPLTARIPRQLRWAALRYSPAARASSPDVTTVQYCRHTARSPDASHRPVRRTMLHVPRQGPLTHARIQAELRPPSDTTR